MQSTLRMQNWLENDKDFNDDSDMDPDFVENEDLPENIPESEKLDRCKRMLYVSP